MTDPFPYIYRWNRCGRKGQKCKVTARGSMNSRAWPEQMRISTAAAYVDEKSVDAFKRSVGTLYPLPTVIPGKGQRWLRADLDAALRRIHGRAPQDAAEVL